MARAGVTTLVVRGPAPRPSITPDRRSAGSEHFPGGTLMNSNVSTVTTRIPMVTSSFKDRDSAERAFASLQTRGYTDKDIHVMMSDETRKKSFTNDEIKDSKMVVVEEGHKTLAGTAVGGVVGGAVGATILGVMAAATALTIPGLGLVIAGPLAGALAGGATGAAAGGLAGTLVGAGIPDDRAKVYEKDIKDGSIFLGFTPRNEEDARKFETEWRTNGTPASP